MSTEFENKTNRFAALSDSGGNSDPATGREHRGGGGIAQATTRSSLNDHEDIKKIPQETELLDLEENTTTMANLVSAHEDSITNQSDSDSDTAPANTFQNLTMQEQVLAKHQKTLGPNHPKTLHAMSILALTYRELDRLQDALTLQEQVLESSQRNLGPNHPDTLGTMIDMAWIYKKLGRDQDAQPLQEQVLEKKQRIMEQNPNKLAAMISLVFTYKALGMGLEAQALLEYIKKTGSEPEQLLWQNLIDTPHTLSKAASALLEASDCMEHHKFAEDWERNADQHGRISDPSPEQFLTLVVEDTEHKHTLISLPHSQANLWETFKSQLIENKVHPQEYIYSNRFVVQLSSPEPIPFPRGPRQSFLTHENWKEWIVEYTWMFLLTEDDPTTSIDPAVLHLKIIAENPCLDCERQPESNLSCSSCNRQFVDLQNLLPQESAEQVMVQQRSQNTPTLGDNDLASGPHFAGSDIWVQEPTMSSQIQAITSSFTPNSENSVTIRQRHKSLAQETSDDSTVAIGVFVSEDWENSRITVGSSSPEPSLLTSSWPWFSRALHGIVAPGFIVVGTTERDLKNCLKKLPSIGVSANGALLALPAAFLALSNVMSSPGARSFVILAGIFNFFGFIYALYMAFHLESIHQHIPTSTRHHPGSLWDLAVMLYLPYTCIAWAIASFLLGAICYVVYQFANGPLAGWNKQPFGLFEATVLLLVSLVHCIYLYRIYKEVHKLQGLPIAESEWD